MSKHSHDHAYFCFVRRGIFSETVGNRTHTRGPSMLIFHSPYEEHSDSFQRLGGRCFNIQVDNSLLGHAREYGVRLEGSSHFQGGLLLSLPMRLYHEAKRQDDLSALVIEGLVLEILAEASRSQYCFSEGKPPRWLERAREIIHVTCCGVLTVGLAQTRTCQRPLTPATPAPAPFSAQLSLARSP